MKSVDKTLKMIENLSSIGDAHKMIRELNKDLEYANRRNRLDEIMSIQPLIDACKSKLNKLEDVFVSECVSAYSK